MCTNYRLLMVHISVLYICRFMLILAYFEYWAPAESPVNKNVNTYLLTYLLHGAESFLRS